MKKLNEWVKNKKNRIKQSRGFLAILMLAIGISYTICFYEGEKLYQDYMEAIKVSEKYLNQPKVIIINEAEAEETKPEAVDELEEIASKIQMLESSGGVNDGKCERIGGHNSYGFGQGNGRNFCLESDEAMKAKVKEWLKERIPQYGLATTLCIYNEGKAVDNCHYAELYRTL